MKGQAAPGIRDAAPPCAVLVVDDDALIREQLTTALHGAGYEVHSADSATQALRDLARTPCQVVIADWEMPSTDGLSLCRTIRQQQTNEYVYVLMLTVRRATADLAAGLEAGADDYIVKGVPMQELVARVERVRRLGTPRGGRRADRCMPRGQPAVAVAADERRQDPPDSSNLAMKLAWEYDCCRRSGIPISILLCIPDDAARLRACFGAAIGAQFLAGLRAGVPKLLLGSDWVERCGDEGFVVVLPHTGLDGARLVAEKIRAAVAASAAQGTAVLPVTVSIGAASIDDMSALQRFMPADLLRTSENCLAQSRQLGGNRTTAARVSGLLN